MDFTDNSIRNADICFKTQDCHFSLNKWSNSILLTSLAQKNWNKKLIGCRSRFQPFSERWTFGETAVQRQMLCASSGSSGSRLSHVQSAGIGCWWLFDGLAVHRPLGCQVSTRRMEDRARHLCQFHLDADSDLHGQCHQTAHQTQCRPVPLFAARCPLAGRPQPPTGQLDRLGRPLCRLQQLELDIADLLVAVERFSRSDRLFRLLWPHRGKNSRGLFTPK